MNPLSMKEFKIKKKLYTKEAIFFAIKNSKNKLKNLFSNLKNKKFCW